MDTSNKGIHNYLWIEFVKQEFKSKHRNVKLESTTSPTWKFCSIVEKIEQDPILRFGAKLNESVQKQRIKRNLMQVKEEQKTEHIIWETPFGDILVVI